MRFSSSHSAASVRLRLVIGVVFLAASSELLTGCQQDSLVSDGGSGGLAASGGASSGGSSAGGTNAAGGGSSDGGSTSGGSTSSGGSGSFFGDSRCNGDFLLCDGFEDASIDTAKWTVTQEGTTTLGITTDQAARGAQSVHIQTTNGFGYLKNTSVFPLTQNDYYGRMFLRVARYSTVAWAHWTVAEAAGNGDGSLIRVGGQYKTDASKNRWGIGSDGGPTGDWTTHDTDPDGAPQEPPLDTWTCLEWFHGGSSHETKFFTDGVEHPSLATTTDEHGGNAVPYMLPEFTSLWFGWYQYQDDPQAFDVWIDEVAIDDERIGCDR